MKIMIRAGAAVVTVLVCGMYVYTALEADSQLGWINRWRFPAVLSISVMVAVFVLTLERTGTRGSVLSNLGATLQRTKLRDPVEGVAQVVTASGLPRSGQNAGSAMCEMNLVITVPGQPSVAVNTASFVKLAKWPSPGMALPVRAERTDIRRFKILWDQVSTGWDQGWQQAQAIADQMNRADTNGVGVSSPDTLPKTAETPGFVNRSITVNGHAASPEEISAFETITGMDLDGDGTVGPPTDNK